MLGKEKLVGAWPFGLSVVVLLWAWGLSLPAWGQDVFKTRRVVVEAKSTADLVEMERRLHFVPEGPASPAWGAGEYPIHPALPRLAAKIDAILVRVSHLLNLRPSRLPPLRIVLLTDGKEVRRRHLALQPGQRPGLFGYGSLEAFYQVCHHTIYLSLADLHEGILAHEMVHYLFCTALAVPPPDHLQEAWAQYVETRL